MATSNDRVRRFFGSAEEELEHLNITKEALASRIEIERADLETVEDLERFGSLLANRLIMTKPRFVKVADPESDLEKLFAELVSGQRRLNLDWFDSRFRLHVRRIRL